MSTATVETVSFPIDKIIVRDGRRAVDSRKVRELAESIAVVGLLNPISLTVHGVLVAGLHRLEACRLLGWSAIPAGVVDGDGLDAELAMIDENLCRNDLTALERAEHLARRDELLAAKGVRSPAHRPEKGRNGCALMTTAAIAQEAGVSERTAQLSKQIVRDVPRDVRDTLRATPLADSTTELVRLSRLAPDRQRAVAAALTSGTAKSVRDAHKVVEREQRKSEAASYAASAPADDHGIIVCDMSMLYDWLADDSVDLIFTDPPYDANGIGQFGNLARLGAAKLKPGGLCLVYCGQMFLPDVLLSMREHLTYWWTFAIRFGDKQLAIWSRHIHNGWRCVLAFAKPPVRPAPEWTVDILQGSGRDKRFHDWGQSVSEAEHLIRCLSEPGAMVVDPFCGGAAIPAACKLTGRRWLATEKDQDTAMIARKRLADMPLDVGESEAELSV